MLLAADVTSGPFQGCASMEQVFQELVPLLKMDILL